jgi:hypothetical protein
MFMINYKTISMLKKMLVIKSPQNIAGFDKTPRMNKKAIPIIYI